MKDEAQLRRIALLLLMPGAGNAALSGLSANQWARLDGILAEHRLQPLLHAEHSGAPTPVPEDIARGWAAAHRTAALAALRQRGVLLRAHRTLAEAGIRAVALKGTWLAWHAYRAPALRPMRDLDLLVASDLLPRAWDALVNAGYSAPLGGPQPALAKHDKHLPPLFSPEGVAIELHARVWENEAQAGHPMPRGGGGEGFIERAQSDGDADPALYPRPDDMLAHLIVHAVYSHWLDCGPLVLADVDALLRRAAPDWPAFWRRAGDEGWQRGAALILGLADRWRRPGILAASGCPVAPPGELLDGAPDLLLQSAERRAEARIIARLQRDGVAGLARAKWAEAQAHPAHFASSMMRRAGQLLGGAASSRARGKAGRMKQLGDWLLSG